MQGPQREKLVHSIVSGYSRFNKLKINRPNYSIEYEADIVYEETYNEAILNGLINNDSILDLLYRYELWDLQDEGRFNEIPQLIEDTKLRLYEERLHSETVKSLKVHLNVLRNEYGTLFGRRHSYDSYTAEGVSQFSKLCYMVRSCTFKGEKLYRFNEETLEEVIYEYQRSTLSEEQLRDIARNEPWGVYWSSLKSGIPIFKEPNEEQRKIIRISSFYDNLHQSPDCPPNFVIEDDDMLDGYLICTRKEREKESNSKDIEGSLSDKVANSAEVYVVCENQDDAKKVYDLNGAYAKAVQGAREKIITEKGRVNEVDLPDVKKKLQMEMAKIGL